MCQTVGGKCVVSFESKAKGFPTSDPPSRTKICAAESKPRTAAVYPKPFSKWHISATISGWDCLLLAVGQNQWHHFRVGAPPILFCFSGDWDVHWGYGLLAHGLLTFISPSSRQSGLSSRRLKPSSHAKQRLACLEIREKPAIPSLETTRHVCVWHILTTLNVLA